MVSMCGHIIRNINVPTATRVTHSAGAPKCAHSFLVFCLAAGPVRHPPNSLSAPRSSWPAQLRHPPRTSPRPPPRAGRQGNTRVGTFQKRLQTYVRRIDTAKDRRAPSRRLRLCIEGKRSQPPHASRTPAPFHSTDLHPTNCPCPKPPPRPLPGRTRPPSYCSAHSGVQCPPPPSLPPLLLVNVGEKNTPT